MDVHGKVWGITGKIFAENNVEVHRIVGNAGGTSSMHVHTHKASMFYVERGCIKVVIEKNDYDLVDETILTAGQSTTIRPGEYHRFEIMEECVCYEIYWVKLDPDDIKRRDCGSIKRSHNNI